MLKSFPAFLLFFAAALPLTAQNFNITYKNPDQLVVCASDTLRINVLNNTAAPISNAFLDLELPSGLTYLPGSVGGAAESDISNLGKPVLALPQLLPGVAAIVYVQLSADCGLVEAINSGQLFSTLLRVRDGAVSEELQTTNFQIQTSLLVITQIDNKAISGEKGDVLMRTIHVRNTRLGPVQHLFLRDTHPAGISIHVDGAATEQDQPTLYTAYFDGAFFTQFGDGDDLLEFGETALIKQQITITDCGIPSYNCRSNIVSEWSCTAVAPPCQGDSTFADVAILPSTDQPKLVFETEYALPWDHCAERPHPMKLRVINEGSAAATNIALQINSGAPAALGMDKTSFKIKRNGVTLPLVPNVAQDFLMEACSLTNAGFISLFIPEMKGGDTAYISFDAFYCLPECKQLLPGFRLNYYYNKPCPVGGFVVADTVEFKGVLADYLSAGIGYTIGDCLEDGMTYPFFYRLTSNRLLSDSGYVWLRFDLPVGLEWSSDCPFKLGDKTPTQFSITPMVTKYPINRVLAAFELPLDDTSALAIFCLKNTCHDSASYVYFDNDYPASGDNFSIYEPNACVGCGYQPDAAAMLSLHLDDDLACAVQTCETFDLRTACPCPPDFVPPSPPSPPLPGPDTLPPFCPPFREYFEAYRINYDLADNDDDRKPDLNGTIDLSKVRRDRFLPGDTIRNILSTKIVCGDSIRSLFYQLFTEVIGSDYGYAAVFDTFPIGPTQTDPARYGFTDSSKIEIVAAELTIWDSSANMVYVCPVETQGAQDKMYGEVTSVNTKPATIFDKVATMNYPISPSMAALSDSGCLPSGFLLEAGDSAQLRVDIKFDMNYAPRTNQHNPPLINFEMGYNSNKGYKYYNYRNYDTLMFQYSGYVDSLNTATFGIKPCDNSVQITPFAYDIRIARENLFPFEVRPLSQIVNYDLIMPPGLTPLSAELLFLNLQSNIPVQQNLPLPISVVPDSMLHVDFSPAYQMPLDEGYGMRSRVVFEPSCTFTMPDSSAQWVTLDFPGCMSHPDSPLYVLESKIGFFSNHPRDTMTTTEAVLDFPTAQVLADVLLRNKAPIAAPNFWVQLINPENGLSDLTITFLGTGTVISPTNGLYQLGSLPVLGTKALRITGINNTCDPQHLLLLYGWDCKPYLVPGEPSCGAVDTLEILFRPRNPEIELELIDFPIDVPLCDTSDYFILELSNADLGYAYAPFVNLELPAGLQLLAGSCQLAYPLGSNFVPIPDPVPVGTNLLEWELAALQDSLAARGLPGVDMDPKNALQIRFKVIAACGAVSNAQLIFGARAKWFCGKATNTLRKASDPILVEGLVPNFETQISLSGQAIGGQGACQLDQKISVNILVSGPGSPGDSIYALLPAGFIYKPLSYLPGANAPTGTPQIQGNTLRWPMPANLLPNTLIQFSFEVLPQDPLNCNTPVLSLETRQQVTAFCPTINANCQVYVVNGAAAFALPSPANVELDAATLTITADGKANYTVTITNPNAQTLEFDLVQFFYDANNDGIPVYPDELLYTIGELNIVLGPGATVDVPINGMPSPDSLCNLLAVLPSLGNCICPVNPVPVTGVTVQYATEILCPEQSISLGVAEMAGHDYSWTSASNLPCTDCAELLFAPPGPGSYSLNLSDQGPGCIVQHAYLVEVQTAPVLQAGNTTVCQGKTVALQTSAALSWNWQGPGISNPAAAAQNLQVQQSAWYFVTATNAAGCVLHDSVFVTAIPLDTTDLGILRTCEGTPVDIFGNMTDIPGTYTQTLNNVSGCDSLIYLILETTMNTEAFIARCPPDTVLIFDEPITEPGTYCQTFTSSLGCDSMHCVELMYYSVPELPDPDTFYIAQGSSVVLPGPGGYAGYLWTPADSLSCTTCQSPTAAPTDTMTYRLMLTTADGCFDTLVYRVVLFPPCDLARIRIPNVFTPDGDGTNDVFAVVPHEGSEVISRLTIYNRWGQKVYDASGQNAAWDGTTFGKPAPSDVYVWLLEVLCDGEPKILKGDVTVLR